VHVGFGVGSGVVDGEKDGVCVFVGVIEGVWVFVGVIEGVIVFVGVIDGVGKSKVKFCGEPKKDTPYVMVEVGSAFS